MLAPRKALGTLEDAQLAHGDIPWKMPIGRPSGGFSAKSQSSMRPSSIASTAWPN